MKFLLAFILVPALLQAQTKKKKIELVKRYDYVIEISVWNNYSGIADKFVLNNIANHGSSIEKKPYILLVIRNTKFGSKTDTVTKKFSRLESDSLFNLTKNFFSRISFNNVDTVVNGQITEVEVSDDSNAAISLEFGKKKLSTTIESISHPKNASKELNKLLRYLWNFQPKQ
jgi:hypothetical protein